MNKEVCNSQHKCLRTTVVSNFVCYLTALYALFTDSLRTINFNVFSTFSGGGGYFKLNYTKVSIKIK